MAEQFALVVWPSLIAIALILITAHGSHRALGPIGAIAAIACLMLWFPTGGMFLAPGRIDHHNVQILAMTILTYAMISESPATRRGILAGLATAASLAVGLETLVYIATAGGIMALRASLDRPGANRLLATFCLTLVPATALLLAAQTAPAQWLTPQCDAIGTPILAITGIAAAACLIPMALRTRLPHAGMRMAATALLTVLGIAAFSGLLMPCLAGPYGALPPEIQTLMTTRISEAQPGMVFAAGRPLSFGTIFLPALTAVLLAALLWATRAAPPAVWQMIVLALVGAIGSFAQIRVITLAAPALPFLAGYVFASLAPLWRAQRSPLTALAIVVAFLGIFAPKITTSVGLNIAHAISGPDGARKADDVSQDRTCRDADILTSLNALPPARLLTPLNLGTPLLLLTHHSALTAPYHRSADAFANGVNPFIDAGQMTAALARTKADYVVICRAETPVPEFAVTRALLDGAGFDGLVEETIASPDLMVFKVVRP
jgi:hypothetical protein